MVEEKAEKKEHKEEKEKRSNNFIVYIPVVVFVVLMFIIGFFIARNRNTQEVATEQETDNSLFEDSGLSERKNEILLSDFSQGEIITVEYVLLENSGYVAIHEQVNGKPGKVIGVSELLESGESENVKVPLDRESEKGEILFAFLHHDDGDGEFSFPGPDTPVTGEYKNIIMSMFRVGDSEITIEELQTSTESAQ